MYQTPRWPRQPALVLVANRQRSMTRADRVATLEEAKAQIQKSWTRGQRQACLMSYVMMFCIIQCLQLLAWIK
jgi:hypothetical protein